MLKRFRSVLYPVSVFYGRVIWFRNWLYDKKILKSISFNFPIICVGNLATGGTGKTPMVEYLVRMLKDEYKVATLSRGYKRKTRGFAIANANTTALDIGDEPMQFHNKFPDITVAVAEERLVAIPQLLHDRPETQVIVLDDALQHRQVRAGLNILLTEYKNLYTRDLILPAGDLRDVESSSKRAEIIIITKCNPKINKEERIKLINEINALPHQQVFFTRFDYSHPYQLFSKEERTLNAGTHVLLICGIANPKPLKEQLNTYSVTYDIMIFSDHHIFDIDDLKNIKRQFDKIKSPNKIILTTEKDGVRLAKFEAEFKDLPVFVLPVRHKFMFDEESRFKERIRLFLSTYNAQSFRR